MAFEVKVSGAGRRLRVDWAKVAGAWADEVEPLTVAALKRAAPVGQGPGAGHLRDSISAKRTGSAAELVLTFTSSAPYAQYVLEGTRAHGPVRARFMHWTDGGGNDVFARWVRGTKPNPFPKRALGPLAAVIEARLAAAIAEQLTA